MPLNNYKDLKYICLHGLKISDELDFLFKIGEITVDIKFIPYDIFVKKNIIDFIINKQDIVNCDIVVATKNYRHNTLEIYLIKIIISILYFAYRMRSSELRIKEKEVEKKKEIEVFFSCFNEITKKNILETFKKSNNDDYFENYNLNGFMGENNIIHYNYWYIYLGKNELNNDNFERWITRGYGHNLLNDYQQKQGIEQLRLYSDVEICVDDNLKDKIQLILSKINKDDEYSRKLVSSFRLYYDLICGYQSPEQADISLCTIFETLLLGKDEDNQRKKVSVRAACIIENKGLLDRKKFIANQIYYFYKCRNAIIHDGRNILDFNESVHTSLFNAAKHIVYYIVKYIVLEDIKLSKEITDLVKSNVFKDNLSKGFEYIDFKKIDNNEPVSVTVYVHS